ncbi:hypothetical protein [Crocosphaera sp.]
MLRNPDVAGPAIARLATSVPPATANAFANSLRFMDFSSLNS